MVMLNSNLSKTSLTLRVWHQPCRRNGIYGAAVVLNGLNIDFLIHVNNFV